MALTFSPFCFPLSGGGGSLSGKSLAGQALKLLDGHLPKQMKGGLRSFYAWTDNKDQDYDLLKSIVRNIAKKI